MPDRPMTTVGTGLSCVSAVQPPFCLRCQRTVEEWSVETPVETVWSYLGGQQFHTGEVIVGVKCHGEAWKASNWRGRMA